MEWEEFWSKLLKDNKIKSKIENINEVDFELYGEYKIEKICHNIYDNYPQKKLYLEDVRQKLLCIIDNFPGVHLQISRVKDIESLLCKVVKNKHAHMLDDNNPYHDISDVNYDDIVTDLIGIRLIISYRGKWIDLHNKIISQFPYAEDLEQYKIYKYIPHNKEGKPLLAEIPKVYHAPGDDTSIYNDQNVECCLKENGYRSVHYIVSFMNTYVEIQLRTIYDEAWSDCDHNYVYKKDYHESFSALKELSKILSLLTNASNDLGEMMQYIFDEQVLREKDGKYVVNLDNTLSFRDIFDKITNASTLLEEFNNRIVEKRGDGHE